MEQPGQILSSSYRDPSGFMFEMGGILYRQVNIFFKEHYDHFINSGCYAHFVKENWIVPHEETGENILHSSSWYKTIKPLRVPFISYPYEWPFDMLKDAALLTLRLLKEGLAYGILLKDATPYNIQWIKGSPVFIDSLSFEKYDPIQPWIAYRQFCENFLSPLLLMHYNRQPMQALQLGYPDGIPLSLTRSLLPWKSKLSLFTWLHIHLHSKLVEKHTGKQQTTKNFSQKKLEQLAVSLESLIRSLKWKGRPTVWEHYYEEAAQREAYLQTKKGIIREWLSVIPGAAVATDMGGNAGEFSQIATGLGLSTITTDTDHTAINTLYLKVKQQRTDILPLLVDVTNPSPATGLNNTERDSFIQRNQSDICLALALIHHLSVGKNIPFRRSAEFFAGICQYLVIEFVPKSDGKVQLMLSQKKDIYPDYTEENFIQSYEHFFYIVKSIRVGDTGRTLFLMKKHA